MLQRERAGAVPEGTSYTYLNSIDNVGANETSALGFVRSAMLDILPYEGDKYASSPGEGNEGVPATPSGTVGWTISTPSR